MGNSGFSLWNRRMMQNLTQRFPAPADVQLDLHWVPLMLRHHRNATLCPKADAQLFSVETEYVSESRPIGWHRPFYGKWTLDQKKEFSSHCPSFHYQRSEPLPT